LSEEAKPPPGPPSWSYEMPCYACDGSGYVQRESWTSGEDEVCAKCRGSGYIPNAEGEMLLRFMRRYFRQTDTE